MIYRILLYGATGFTGRLIAQLAAERWSKPGARYELVLGARDEEKLRNLARRYDVEYRVFSLDRREPVLRALDGADVVINAAGPFASTAERLAKASISAGCHYVDINGEADVYKKLDDLGRIAAQRDVTLVCSAGYLSVASNLLLEKALTYLENLKGVENHRIREPVTVRIAMSSLLHASRGSAYTALRSLREQVTVARVASGSELVLWHVPVGELQRTFAFGTGARQSASSKRDLRIASAMNLVDTLTARVEAMRHKVRVNRIESYVETGTVERIAQQLGAMGSPLLALPWIQALARSQVSLLPEGPTKEERAARHHILILEIEDANRTPVIDWRLEGPNVYDVTAEAVTKVAECVAKGKHRGWCTPAEVFHACPDLEKAKQDVPLKGCRLEQRIPVR
jgi:short subunit dehydrogenase-like uncharacterized protein